MEVRDPIHNLITYNEWERKIIDSPPFQRLRHIHQLAMGYLVYPGATHKRFEHSIGVMHLAGKAFDSITNQEKVHRVNNIHNNQKFKEVVQGIANPDHIGTWRQTLRFAALCHDIGHLPFSHSGEDANLFPDKKPHEWMTAKLIKERLSGIMNNSIPRVDPIQVAKIAVGINKWKKVNEWGEEYNDFSNEELILTEIITGDFFGVDRMDYLLRDAYHSGVSYGTIDHQRLLDTMAVLPSIPVNKEENFDNTPPALGIEKSGLHNAEGMIIARYFMYKQVYFHHVRKAYDKHLADCMKKIFKNKKLGNVDNFLKWTDNEIIVKIQEALRDSHSKLHEDANRLLGRKHYRCVYTIKPEDLKKDKNHLNTLFEKLKHCLDTEDTQKIFHLELKHKGTPEIPKFPVLSDDNGIENSKNASELYQIIPPATYGYIFASPDIKDKIIDEMKRIQQQPINNQTGGEK